MARSSNGITGWSVINDAPILGPGVGKWDQHAVYKPTIVYDDESQVVMIWYNGRFKHSEKIGLAERYGIL